MPLKYDYGFLIREERASYITHMVIEIIIDGQLERVVERRGNK